MMITKNDKSRLRYEKDLQSLVYKPGYILKARLRARHRQMYLYGRVLTEDAQIVEVETEDYLVPIYSLYLEEMIQGKIVNQVELLCGLSAHDPYECWKIIRRHHLLPFGDIEGILSDYGYPNEGAFDRKIAAGINGYARYHNIISRSNFDTNSLSIRTLILVGGVVNAVSILAVFYPYYERGDATLEIGRVSSVNHVGVRVTLRGGMSLTAITLRRCLPAMKKNERRGCKCC